MEVEELMKQLSAGGINVQGDFVMKKEVQYEVNAAPGAVGIIIKGDSEIPSENEEDTPLIKELMPIFMNVRKEVIAYITAINGQTPTAVTEKTNEYVRAGKIVKVSRKGELYGILNKYGFYKLTESTWNKQVN